MDPRWHCKQAERAVRGESQGDSPEGASELLLQLLGVYEAAAWPLEAVRLGLELCSGEQGVGLSPVECISVISAAMAVANDAGRPLGALMMFEELLAMHGSVSHPDVLEQVRILVWHCLPVGGYFPWCTRLGSHCYSCRRVSTLVHSTRLTLLQL